jgi:hypothetical protein
MAVNLSPYGGVGAQFLDNAGNVLTGGKIYTYAGGTTTSQATYTTSAGNVPHPNPIILDAAGRVPGGEIWLTDGLVYKFILRDANDVLIATYDGITGINSNFVAFTNQQEIQTATAGQTVFNLTTMSYAPGTNSLSVFVDGVNQYGPGAQYAYLETDSDTVTFVNGLHVGAEVKFTTSQLNSSGLQANAFQVSYTPPFTGSVGTNVGDKLAQYVSVKDFGAVGDGVADDTAAIQSAVNNFVGEGCLFFPEGTYNITSPIVINKRLWIKGDNSRGTKIKNNGTGDALQFTTTWYQRISNIYIEGNGGSNDGIRLETSHFVMEDVWCADNGRHGFFVQPDTYIISAINCTFYQNGGDGVNAVATSSSGQINDVQFVNCGFWLNNVGLRINAVAACIQGSFIESNATYGVYADATAFNMFGPLVIQNNYFEANLDGQVYIHTNVGYIQNIKITSNYFFVGTPNAGAAHILAKRETGGQYIRDLEISDNFYLSNVTMDHVNLDNALLPKYGNSVIRTTQSGDTASWDFFYKNIGYAAIQTYQRRTNVFGRTSSAGDWTYPDNLYSSNIISLGAGDHEQEYEFPLTSGNTYIQTGVYVNTDSTDFNLVFDIIAVQATNATTRNVTGGTFLNISGSGLRQTLDISDATSVNNGRLLSGEKLILRITVRNNDGGATTLRVSNPFVRYME